MSSNKPNDEWGGFFEGVTGQPQMSSPPIQPNSAVPPASVSAQHAGSTTRCTKCGATSDASQKFCGSCGAPLQAPASGMASPPQPQPVQMVYVQPASANPVMTKSRTNALLIEALVGIFLGVYGIGWIYAGQSDKGIKYLILGLVWMVIAAVLAAITAGLFLCVSVPVSIVIVAKSVNGLNDFAKQNPHLFHG
jgi:TM2 domain-containing membrane protein YozV